MAADITLRGNWGSHPVVTEVVRFDPEDLTVIVALDYGHCKRTEAVPLSELEALDADRRYVNVRQVVIERAKQHAA